MAVNDGLIWQTGHVVPSIGWDHSQWLHVLYSAVITVASELGQAGCADLIFVYNVKTNVL